MSWGIGRDAGKRVVKDLHTSLRALKMDHVDIYLLHSVTPDSYAEARDRIAPALMREREKGSVRFIGFSEHPRNDFRHDAAVLGIEDGIWDVMMLAFSMMNQNARVRVLPAVRQAGIGTIIMYAVRRLFSQPDRLKETIDILAANGQLPAALAALDDPLEFLIHPGGAESVLDADYRYVRHEPGVDVTLFGTGNADHMRDNIASMLRPPLPEADRRRLVELFGALEGIGIDRPLVRGAT